MPWLFLPHSAPTDLNSASADQFGATKWHYNHLPIHPPMQNFEIQFKPILTLCQQLYGPVIATLGPNWPQL